MNPYNYTLLLADDDEDDCDFFIEALAELPFSATVTTVGDGVELLQYLSDCPADALPDILFLDLNMPRKNGMECITEIKESAKLKNLPVIIISTSLDLMIINFMYETGALFYIRKPGDFSKLKKVIEDAITKATENNFTQGERNHFILQS